MENRNNKKGFTLIEMLVVIAIIGALSVVIGVSATGMMQKSNAKGDIATYKEIFKNARIYYEMVKPDGSHYCASYTTGGNCNISLKQLVDLGLLDKKIYNEYNPAYYNRLFSESDTVNVSIASGFKKVSMSISGCGTLTEINEDNINTITENEKWGTC